MKSSLRSLALLPLLLLLGACASTPDQRIQKNQDLFNSFPVADQARIRSGQIDIGFSPEMVRIAMGAPQRQLVRRTPAGEGLVWLYLDTSRHYERQRADIEGLSLTGVGGTRTVGGGAWINILQEREFVRARIEFQNGAVTAIEEIGQGAAAP